MYEGYDKPLHPPLKWQSMETEGRELDEAKLDSAIADLFSEDKSEKPEPAERTAQAQAVLPELPEQETVTEEVLPKEAGLAATLLQKWAGLRGAA